MNLDYTDSYGTWRVTTEADDEGRLTKDLGIYSGPLSAIAFYLKDKCGYKLEFSPVKINVVSSPNVNYCGSVNVALDIKSKTWEMGKYERVKFFKHLLNTEMHSRAVVEASDFYASVKLVGQDNPEEQIKKIALAKLTEEEKEVLGLLDN